jgi:hypothetical protein
MHETGTIVGTRTFLFQFWQEDEMADGNGGGGNALLGVIVGVLLVLVIGFFVFGGIPSQRGAAPSSGPSATLTVTPGKSWSMSLRAARGDALLASLLDQEKNLARVGCAVLTAL